MKETSLRRRLYFWFALVAVIFVCGAAGNLWLLQDHRNGMVAVTDTEFKIQHHAQELRYIVTEMQRLALQAALEADEDQLMVASAQSNRFFDHIEEIRRLLNYAEEDTSQLSAIEDSYRYVMTSVLTLIAEHIERIARRDSRLAGVHDAANRFAGDLDQFVASAQARSDREVRRLLDQLEWSITAHWLAIGFAGLMLIGALVFLDRTLTRPTGIMADSLERISHDPVHTRERLPTFHDDEIGKIGHVINTILDRLHETVVSRDYFDHVVSSVTNALLVTSPEGTIRTVNRASLDILGYTETELSGLPIDGVVVPPIKAEWKQGLPSQPQEAEAGSIVKKLLDEDKIRGVEMALLAKGGKRIPVLFSGAVMKDETDQVTGLVCVAADITERTAVEEALARKSIELEDSNEELRRFAYVASHDLQEPLRLVTTYLQFFERRYGKDLGGEAREFVDIVINAAKRMRELIRDFLAYSRVDSREIVLEDTDLNEVVETALSNLAPRIEETGANISIPDILPTVLGDAVRLTSLFQNLLSNAMKYRLQDRLPEVGITADRSGDEWQISVDDNGIGIEPEYQDKIFMIFQRLHGQETYDGTGIGLALCKRIVEQHGGRIWVTSTPGQGSTFHFSLPETGASPP